MVKIISEVKTDNSNKPIEKIVIKSVTVKNKIIRIIL